MWANISGTSIAMGGMTALDSLAAQVTSAVTGMGVTAVVVAVVVAEAGAFTVAASDQADH
jgi:hypothetical protein